MTLRHPKLLSAIRRGDKKPRQRQYIGLKVIKKSDPLFSATGELPCRYVPLFPNRLVFRLTKIRPGVCYVFTTKDDDNEARDSTFDYRKSRHPKGITARSIVMGQWCLSMVTQR